MQTLFVPMPGYFPNRHRTFIETLCRNFNLILHDASAWNISGGNISHTTDVVKEIGDVTNLAEFQTQWDQYCNYTTRTLAQLLGHSPDRSTLDAHFRDMKPKLAEALKRALVLSEISKQTQIDMMVTGSDYTHYNRPFTFMAAREEIPSVHIEHGLLALTPYPGGTSLNWHMRFASNYVILDNPLEAHIFSKFRRQENIRELLPLGAPLDNSVATSGIDKTEAKKQLGIDGARKCVTIVLSWNEPNTPVSPVHNQRIEVEFVEFVMAGIKRLPECRDVQLILKCHPAVVDFGQYNAYQNYFRYLASRHGIAENVTVTDTKLDEVVAASDLMLSWRTTSVLWDAIMRNRQAAVWLPHFSTKPEGHSEVSPQSAVSEAGICPYFKSDTELMDFLSGMFDDERQKTFRTQVAAFKTKWQLNPGSAVEKSERIVAWIKKTIVGAGTPKA